MRLVGSSRFNIDRGVQRVAYVEYSSEVDDFFDLQNYTTVAEIQSHIASSMFSGSKSTFHGAALELVHERILTPAGGDRSQAPNTVIVLTDGLSDIPYAFTKVSIQK